MDTGRDNVKKTGVMDDVITRDNTEYSSHTLDEEIYGKSSNEWVLIKRSRNGR